MGDRGNVAIIHNHGQVWLYSHWGGSELKDNVRAGLAKEKNRWRDPSYLTANIAAEVKPSGISCSIEDNSHDIVVVDILKQRVFLMPENHADNNGQVPQGYEPDPESVCTFEKFTARAEPVTT